MTFSDGLTGAVLIASPDGKVTYWSPAAAAELGWSDLEARQLGIQGLFSTAGEVLAATHTEGAPVLDPASRRVKVFLKSGRAALFESQIVPLADAGGCAYGHLYVLQPVESDGKAASKSGLSPVVQAVSIGRQVLHQLNNVFASIHSSLDLALGAKQRVDAESFLLQAQTSARKGALVVHELWTRGRELPAPAGAGGSSVESRVVGQTQHDASPSPESLEGSERVLVAEDDNSLRVLMRAVLTYRGYKVVEAVDGGDAVDKYRTDGPFDLVILDMAMPTLDGPEVLQQIRAQNASARALALSGTPFESEAELQDPVSRFDGFLNKPFRNIDLLKLVRRVLDHNRGADPRPAS
jgi:CheY-like chemotaxis protein